MVDRISQAVDSSYHSIGVFVDLDLHIGVTPKARALRLFNIFN